MFTRVRDKLKSRGGNYPYVTARVRALKTYLLPESEYAKLFQRDLHEIARSLGEGRYKDEVDELAGEHTGAALVERATRLNMGRQFSKILSWCKGEPEELLELYFHRYQVHNIKTVLRGVQAGASTEEIRLALIPASVAPEETFLAATTAETLEEAINALRGTGYDHVLDAEEDLRLSEIENALDEAYYETLVQGFEPRDRPTRAFHDFLKREVDILNLKLVLRAKHKDLIEYQLVPRGRHVDDDLARRIQGAEWSEVASILEETPFGPVLRSALQDYQEDKDLNHLAAVLDQHHLDEASDFGHRYPLSILPLIDYVLRKKREVDRLRIIAVGKAHGLPRDEIKTLVGL